MPEFPLNPLQAIIKKFRSKFSKWFNLYILFSNEPALPFKNKIVFFSYVMCAIFFWSLTVFINVTDASLLKGSGGGASLILLIGSILVLLIEGETGRIIFSIITIFGGVFYCFKAMKCISNIR